MDSYFKKIIELVVEEKKTSLKGKPCPGQSLSGYLKEYIPFVEVEAEAMLKKGMENISNVNMENSESDVNLVNVRGKIDFDRKVLFDVSEKFAKEFVFGDVVLPSKDERYGVVNPCDFPGLFKELIMIRNVKKDESGTIIIEVMFNPIESEIEYEDYHFLTVVGNLLPSFRVYDSLSNSSLRDKLPRNICKSLLGVGGVELYRSNVSLLNDQSSLNKSQQEALKGCISSCLSRNIACVQGPPGCGKTHFLRELIMSLLQIKKEEPVLVVAATNVAVVNVAMKSFAELKKRKVPFWIIGNEKRVGKFLEGNKEIQKHLLPNALHLLLRDLKDLLALVIEMKEEEDHTRLDEARINLLSWNETMDGTSLGSVINEIYESLGVESSSSTSKHILDAIKDLESTKRQKRLSEELVVSALVLFCTVNMCMSRLLRGPSRFSAVIVDEAAQINEAESSCFIQNWTSSLVLVGDYRQLKGLVMDEKAKELNYSESLMERLVVSKVANCWTLNVQYRMHPEISAFPRNVFYEGKLLDSDSVKSYKIPWHCKTAYSPMIFYHHEGSSEEFMYSSVCNRIEMNIIFEFLSNFYMENVVGSDTILPSVGIICPYKAQVQLFKESIKYLRSSLKKLDLDYKGIIDLIEVRTVDGFQGGEKDIIILSLTRANRYSNIGFLKDIRRMNVAITRAKYSLFIFGDKSTFLSENHQKLDVWKKLVDYCNEEGRLLSFGSFNSDGSVQMFYESVTLTQLCQVGKLQDAIDYGGLWELMLLAPAKTKLQAYSFKLEIVRLIRLLKSGKFNVSSQPYHLDEANLIQDVQVGKLFRVCKLRDKKCLIFTVEIRSGKQYILIRDIVDNSCVLREYEKFLKECNGKSKAYLQGCVMLTASSSDLLAPATNATNIDSSSMSFTNEFGSIQKVFDISDSKMLEFLETHEDGNNELELPYLLDESQEQISLDSEPFTLVIGRGGSGKTSVITDRLFRVFRNCLKIEEEFDVFFLTQGDLLKTQVGENFHELASTHCKVHNVKYDESRFKFHTFISFCTFVCKEFIPFPVFDEELVQWEVSSHQRSLFRWSNVIGRQEFEARFWDQSKLCKSIGCSVVFCEIMTIIKGSEDFNIMSRKDYVDKACSRYSLASLTDEDRESIYDFYEYYERKKKEGTVVERYDLVDVIMRVARHLQNYPLPTFQFFFIDEVQDLLPIQLRFIGLFMNKEKSRVTLAGDQAQAITAGNRFRFSRLKDVFYHHCGVTLKNSFLTRNYRSQSTVIDLANEVTSLIAFFFRDELDSLCRETSNTIGYYKPLLLTKCTTTVGLFSFLFGENNRELGANQCILVKHSSDRDILCALLRENGYFASVFTVLEAKGLEFDDVVLYNILGKSQKLRALMNYKPDLFNNEKIPKFNEKSHGILCDDLKVLYVAVTRTKVRLVVFEEDQTSLRIFSRLCGDLVINDEEENNSRIEAFGVTDTPERWYIRGNEFLQRELFDQAIEAFKRAHSEDDVDLAKALKLLNLARNVEDDKLKTAWCKESGEILIRLKKYKKALDAFNTGSLWYLCAETSLKLNAFMDAIKFYIKGKEMGKAFEIAMSEDISESPSFDKVLSHLARHFMASDPSKVDECVKKICEFSVIESLFEPRRMYMQLKEIAKSRNLLEKAATICFSHLHDYEEAMELLEMAGIEDKVHSELYLIVLLRNFSLEECRFVGKSIEESKLNILRKKEDALINCLMNNADDMDLYYPNDVNWFFRYFTRMPKTECSKVSEFDNLLEVAKSYTLCLKKVLGNLFEVKEQQISTVKLLRSWFGATQFKDKKVRCSGWFLDYLNRYEEESSSSKKMATCSNIVEEVKYLRCVRFFLLKHWHNLWNLVCRSFLRMIQKIEVFFDKRILLSRMGGELFYPLALDKYFLQVRKALLERSEAEKRNDFTFASLSQAFDYSCLQEVEKILNKRFKGFTLKQNDIDCPADQFSKSLGGKFISERYISRVLLTLCWTKKPFQCPWIVFEKYLMFQEPLEMKKMDALEEGSNANKGAEKFDALQEMVKLANIFKEKREGYLWNKRGYKFKCEIAVVVSSMIKVMESEFQDNSESIPKPDCKDFKIAVYDFLKYRDGEDNMENVFRHCNRILGNYTPLVLKIENGELLCLSLKEPNLNRVDSGLVSEEKVKGDPVAVIDFEGQGNEDNEQGAEDQVNYVENDEGNIENNVNEESNVNNEIEGGNKAEERIDKESHEEKQESGIANISERLKERLITLARAAKKSFLRKRYESSVAVIKPKSYLDLIYPDIPEKLRKEYIKLLADILKFILKAFEVVYTCEIESPCSLGPVFESSIQDLNKLLHSIPSRKSTQAIQEFQHECNLTFKSIQNRTKLVIPIISNNKKENRGKLKRK